MKQLGLLTPVKRLPRTDLDDMSEVDCIFYIQILLSRTVLYGDCWIWQGQVNAKGYSYFKLQRKVKYSGAAHRILYLLIKGTIAQGLQLDHLCRNKLCINPDHLEPVTGIENCRRIPYYNRSYCLHGHSMSGNNVGYRKDHYGRYCKRCSVIRAQSSHKRLARK